MESRPGGGGTLQYLPGYAVIKLANLALGFDGWSSSILEDGLVGKEPVSGSNKVKVMWRSKVMIKLSPHLGGGEKVDFGYGTAIDACGLAAVEKASKESVTDGLKRAFQLVGESTGNCFKDKKYLLYAAGEQRSGRAKRVFCAEDTLGVEPVRLAQSREKVTMVREGIKCASSVDVDDYDFGSEVEMDV
ncbi:RAD52 Recombination DNA repair protein RAD52 pathway [Pyrenophora tritici-repentis]|nr:RAD52 Recombination DNA repair protein RAD52 pathway [Pyrenophora tritici-repentis]